ncbi:MAG: hypothetical protein HYZ45_07545 [Burkholderiales bacterium]|nr:hypothetical protein [Burkholderiales bacterium]
MKSRKRIVLAVFILLALLMTGGFFFIRFSFAPHYDFEKNSPAFYLLLDQEIANLPVPSNATSVRFTSIAQDGTAASIDAVLIVMPDLNQAEREFTAYFQSLGYRKQNQSDPSMWVKGDANITMTVEKHRLQVVKAQLR